MGAWVVTAAYRQPLKKPLSEGRWVASGGGSQRSSKVLEEMVKVTVTEIKLLQNCSHLLSFLADSAKDAVDNHVSGNDVKFTGSRAGYLVGADFKILLSKECVEVHGRGWCELR